MKIEINAYTFENISEGEIFEHEGKTYLKLTGEMRDIFERSYDMENNAVEIDGFVHFEKRDSIVYPSRLVGKYYTFKNLACGEVFQVATSIPAGIFIKVDSETDSCAMNLETGRVQYITDSTIVKKVNGSFLLRGYEV